MDETSEEWDRPTQIDVAARLGRIEAVLRTVQSQVEVQNDRVGDTERHLSRHHEILFGSSTELNDTGGIVGMLRQMRQMQRLTVAALGAVVLPAALTLLAGYVTSMMQ